MEKFLEEEYNHMVTSADQPFDIFRKGVEAGYRHATKETAKGLSDASVALHWIDASNRHVLEQLSTSEVMIDPLVVEWDRFNGEVLRRARGTTILDVPLEELQLSTRHNNLIRGRIIDSVRTLVSTPGVTIREIEGIGDRGFQQIQEKLREFVHDRIDDKVKLSSVK